MSKTKRYYVRRILETNKLIVEKSEILDRKKYIIDVTERSEPFEMVSESSEEYTVTVKAAIHSGDRLLEFKSL